MTGVLAVAVSVTPSRVALVPNTNAPVPVSPVTAPARFADVGVARNVATPVPRPETPVLIGKPLALVSVTLEGVPRAGVISVGLLAKTNAPVPVSSEMTPASSAEEVAAKSLSLLAVLALPAARSYAALTEAGTAAVVVEVLEVEFSS
jgi:hypothetical protein